MSHGARSTGPGHLYRHEALQLGEDDDPVRRTRAEIVAAGHKKRRTMAGLMRNMIRINAIREWDERVGFLGFSCLGFMAGEERRGRDSVIKTRTHSSGNDGKNKDSCIILLKTL